MFLVFCFLIFLIFLYVPVVPKDTKFDTLLYTVVNLRFFYSTVPSSEKFENSQRI